jgi:hypothetical protein
MGLCLTIFFFDHHSLIPLELSKQNLSFGHDVGLITRESVCYPAEEQRQNSAVGARTRTFPRSHAPYPARLLQCARSVCSEDVRKIGRPSKIIVAYKPVAKRQLCKQWPLLCNARNIHARNNRRTVSSSND